MCITRSVMAFSQSSSHSVIMRETGWILMLRSSALPELTNLWGIPAGVITIWPAVASIVASPTVKVA
jgi:hypothetical protein